LCELIGQPAMADDPRYANNGERNVNRASLTEALAAAFATQDGNALALRLIRAGVPAGPVLPVDEATAAPHTAHREMVTELDWYRGIGTPIKFSRTKGGTRRPPPKFAQDGNAILGQLGYTAEEIAALEQSGVVHTKRRV
jgi:crotonobetainyl-CoA:carnitine CoA-transferase CaiB-like acyl-CoA transferase